MDLEKKGPLLISAIYFLLGAGWIYLAGNSPVILAGFAADKLFWHSVKDVAFIGLSSLLMFIMMSLYYRRVFRFKCEAAKKAEEYIRESERNLRTILENAPVMIASFDSTGKCILWNRECEKYLGWTWRDLGQCSDLPEKFIPERGERHRLLRHLALAEGTFSEFRVLAENGKKRTQLWANFRLPDRSLICVGHDITLSKQTVGALQRERAFLRSLMDSVPDLIFYKNSKSVYLGCNAAFEEFAGKTEAEIIGKTDYQLFSPDTASQFREMDLMMLECSAARRNEEWVVYPDGRRLLLDTLKTPFYDEQGKILGIIGISRDISEQRRAEEERGKLEAQLLHAQKMEAVGLLAGGVAHDFNNILTAIKGYAYLLRSKIEDQQSVHFIEQLERASDKAVSLTNSLLAFSRKRVLNPKAVEINDALKRSLKLLSRLINEDIEIRPELSSDHLTVLGDESHIDQVVMNLATNARDAMPQGGILTISTSRFFMTDEFVEQRGMGRVGEYVLLQVSDTGTGIKEIHRSQLFQPFFTTKEAGKGTGLGLSIIYDIVKQHDGYIDVKSAVGKGTTFDIFFPIIRQETMENEKKEEFAPAPGNETILIAEDDANARELTRSLLEEFGYRVVEAVDGMDAVAKYIANRDSIQLILLDVIMPRKNGRDVYREIVRLNPDVKAIFLSGYAGDIIAGKGIVQEGLEFITKPILPGMFLHKVREVLGK